MKKLLPNNKDFHHQRLGVNHQLKIHQIQLMMLIQLMLTLPREPLLMLLLTELLMTLKMVTLQPQLLPLLLPTKLKKPKLQKKELKL
jgi:hypothetical protein